jgi:hypothetical protein
MTTIKNPMMTAVIELAEAIEGYDLLNDTIETEKGTLTVLTEWPADGKFKEPSVTVLAPTHRMIRHFPVERPYDIGIDGQKDNASLQTRYRIAQLHIGIDLHVYAKTLRQRGIVEAGLMELLEGQSQWNEGFPNSLRVKSDRYYKEPIRYRLTDNVYRDSESLQIQSQYISILGVECDMDWIISKQEYEIAKMFIHTSVSTEALLHQTVEDEIMIVQ